MKRAPHSPDQPSPYEGLSASDLLAILAEKDAFITAREQQVQERYRAIRERDTRIKLLEEQLRLATIRKFAASSEKLPFQITLFDEVELEAALRELDEQLDLDGTPDDQGDAAQQRRRSRKRQRGFSAALRRERIEF